MGRHSIWGRRRSPNRYIWSSTIAGTAKFTTPKSKKSRRVDLSRELRQTLLELRDKRMLEAFLKGKTSIADEPVFPSTAGTVLDPSNLFHVVQSQGLSYLTNRITTKQPLSNLNRAAE
jgi:hypothetical protein